MEETDVALDGFDQQAREDEPRIVIMDTDNGESYLSIGVGADLVSLSHADDRLAGARPCYAPAVGKLPEGDRHEWAFSTTWNEYSSTRLVPTTDAREAVRQWLRSHD